MDFRHRTTLGDLEGSIGFLSNLCHCPHPFPSQSGGTWIWWHPLPLSPPHSGSICLLALPSSAQFHSLSSFPHLKKLLHFLAGPPPEHHSGADTFLSMLGLSHQWESTLLYIMFGTCSAKAGQKTGLKLGFLLYKLLAFPFAENHSLLIKGSMSFGVSLNKQVLSSKGQGIFYSCAISWDEEGGKWVLALQLAGEAQGEGGGCGREVGRRAGCSNNTFYHMAALNSIVTWELDPSLND